jgi:hypothetical protein
MDAGCLKTLFGDINMDKEYNIVPKINRNDLVRAKKYLWIYLSLFTPDDIYHNHHEIMPRLNSSQQTFLTFCLMEGSMRGGSSHFDDSDPAENWSIKGGFLQLIYDGYGEYVFEKPFSNIIKTWGAEKIGRIVEKAKSIYEKHKDKVEKVKTKKELSHLCSEITDFEMLDKEYMEVSSEETVKIQEYIENNINEFAIIDESNSQASDIDGQINEIEILEREIEVISNENSIIEKYIKDNINKFAINDGNITVIMRRDENNTPIISEATIFEEKYTLIGKLYTFINGKRVIIKIVKKPRN